MKLHCKSLQDLFKLYKPDFLGQKGFLLPGQQPFSPGMTVDLSISVNEEYIGTAKTTMIWQNLEMKGSDILPLGTFFKLLNADKNLEQTLSS
jgi:hypothetical protein